MMLKMIVEFEEGYGAKNGHEGCAEKLQEGRRRLRDFLIIRLKQGVVL